MNTGTVTVTIPLTTPLKIRPVHIAARCCIIMINDDRITNKLAIMSILRRPYFKKWPVNTQVKPATIEFI